MTTTADPLVDRYLKDLDAELRDLPASQRREILDEVGEHIAASRTTPRAGTETGVPPLLRPLVNTTPPHTPPTPDPDPGAPPVLGRRGAPADIAAEARERFGVQAEPARPAT